MQQVEEDAIEASQSSCPPWSGIEHLIILGLGSIEKNAVPRYQLAMALLLAEELSQHRMPICAYDPVFTAVDKSVLLELTIQVLWPYQCFARQRPQTLDSDV